MMEPRRQGDAPGALPGDQPRGIEKGSAIMVADTRTTATDVLTEAVEQRGGRWEGSECRFRCPLPDHADHNPSARYNPTKETWYCDVCKKGGGRLKLARLLGVELRTGTSRLRTRVVAAYDYRDERGNLLFVVERTDPKGFRQKRPNAEGGWIYNLDGIRRVPYRLPDLVAADPAAPILVVEGEKDVDALRQRGFVATCNPEGAGKWRDAYAAWFRGRHVVILPDDDERGRRHADQVARSLHAVAASVKVVVL